MRSQRQPPTSGAVDLPAADRAHVRVVGVPRHLAGAVAAQDGEEPLLRERARLRVAHAQEAVAVEGREPGPLADRDVERRDVREADERLRVRGDRVEVEVRDHLRRAVAALEALDDVDLGVGEDGASGRRRGRAGSPAT